MKAAFLFLSLSLSTLTVLAGVNAQVSNMGDTTHVEFSGLSQWDYDVKRSELKGQTLVEMTVPSLSEKAIHNLEAFRSSDVKEISVQRQGPDGKMIIKLALTSPAMETFDYLTDQPSRLVVDIFQSKGPKDADEGDGEVEAAAPKSTKKSAAVKAKKPEASSSAMRKPATTDILQIGPQLPLKMAANDSPLVEKKSGIFDGADPNFDRFSIADYEIKEESIITSQENSYLDFPILRMNLGQLNHLNTQRPVYEILPKDNAENKQARLLLTLFNNKRFNVYLKTVEWFVEKYPHSEYDEIVRFMWADVLFSLWLDKRNVNDFDLAMLRYRQALEKYPETPLAERTLLLMGYATLDRGDYLGTLRQFQAHLKNRPQSPNRDLARLAVAEAYMKLSRFEEAVAQYREIEKDASSDESKMAAAYLVGDVFMQKKDFTRAEIEYKEALKKYPSGATEYPNAFYNQGSSQFGQKNYRQSLDAYRDFLKRFPSHPFAGYAMTRVGEILDILGADKARVMGAYLETYFRYGDNPSAVVARLRLLSSKMKGMKPKELDKAVDEMQALSKKSELPMIEQFSTLMISEGYNRRQEYDKSIDLLVKYYQAHPTSADTALLSKRIIGNINDKIDQMVIEGRFLDALKTHNQYADNWLKPSQRIDTKYNVGRAFEQAGVPVQAEILYRDTLNKIYSLKGTKLEKARSIIEKLPTEDELNLRLASVTFSQGHFNESYDYLKNIKKPDLMKDVNQIERVQLGATLLDRKGDPDSAIRYLVELLKTWTGRPELVADPYLHLAEIEIKQGKTSDAIQSFKKIDELMEDSGKVPMDTHIQALQKRGDLELEKGQSDDALKSYSRLLSLYEDKRPMAAVRYAVGQLYFKKGEIQKATEFWNELKGQKNDFWYTLAQEQLKNSEWKSDYKKYIQRIPAMSEGVTK
jgi:tetratricopeptide (TPR) repeat protein